LRRQTPEEEVGVVQTAQAVADHPAWKKVDHQNHPETAYCVAALAHPFQAVPGEVHRLEMAERSAYWEVHLEVEGELDHSMGGQAAGIDHFPRDHLNHCWVAQVP